MQDAAETEEVARWVKCPGLTHPCAGEGEIDDEPIIGISEQDELVLIHESIWWNWLIDQWEKPLPAPAVFTVLTDTSEPSVAVLRDCRLDWSKAPAPKRTPSPWPAPEEGPIEDWAFVTPPHPLEPFHPPPSLPFQEALRDLLGDLLKQERRDLPALYIDEPEKDEVALQAQAKDFYAQQSIHSTTII